ncbi:dienelactone hydrolase family protein [Halobium salinum]|uniref:Dienelactone hydrolase family protein n=1 Tax=Halobium salinum TaxID=1364940 RepID=A0ABD5PJU1_9EURY|nr:dienelactone hydrolase family protein [Halobium salinum]
MAVEQPVTLVDDGVTLEGDLTVPDGVVGLVLFAHGSGSSRKSPRNRTVAESLQDRGLATLLFDLLTVEEDRVYENRFDIELLTERLVSAGKWTRSDPRIAGLKLGYFGSSTGAAAALRAAARPEPPVGAVVSRGGRVDLAADDLANVEAATLFVVGGDDSQVLELNRTAFESLHCEKELHVVPGATHLFEEPGALEEVADVAGRWFVTHLS